MIFLPSRSVGENNSHCLEQIGTPVGDLKPWHIILIVVVFVVLFGAKKLPDSAKSVAKSLKIFKEEIKSPEDKSGDDSSSKTN
jgi:sec-independent protein translocase protein TatA